MVSPFLPEDEKLAAIREALPATGAGIYLDTAVVGPFPAETARAVAEIEEWGLRVGRDGPGAAEDLAVRREEARAAVAAVLGADPAAIALAHGAADALRLPALALEWRPGDVLATCPVEDVPPAAPLIALLSRRGVEPRWLGGTARDDGAPGAALVRSLEAALARRPRLVVVPHVSWATGTVLPLPRLGELVRSAGALLAVDGSQAVGAIPVAVEELGVDLYAVAGQAWLLGPEGTGAVWLSDRARSAFGATAASARTADGSNGATVDLAAVLDAPDLHPPSVTGLARSISWISMYIGLPWVYERGARQARLARRLLAAVRGVTVLTPEDAAGLIAFRIKGWRGEEAADELRARTFAILSTVPELEALRLSVAFFTTDAELERLSDGVAELAAHDPADLPPRRSLTMLGGGGG